MSGGHGVAGSSPASPNFFSLSSPAYHFIPRAYNRGASTLSEFPKTYYIQSLGCNKNTVDSEILMTMLEERGFRRVDEPEDADRIIVNTCSFIDEAKQESIDAILNLTSHVKEGARLVVTGCFPQVYPEVIKQKISEVDVITGTGNLNTVIEAIASQTDQRDFPGTRVISDTYSNPVLRTRFLSAEGFAYLKISEGCSRGCSFCLIPYIKGSLRSRPADEILNEAKYLEKKGVNELILTSQDTLSYGIDLGDKRGLQTLIGRLIGETTIPFIRLLYLRPDSELLEMLDLFKNSRVLPYFDMPVQHAAEKVLRNMKREGNSQYYKKVIDEIRNQIPHAVFRTTVITGFPGEGVKEFVELRRFIEKVKFNHVGVFVFSMQRETGAYQLGERVKIRVAERRKDVILSQQREISHGLLGAEVGRTFDVLIEERIQGEKLYFGRSYHFAPEVDGIFVVKSEREITPGSIIRVRATSAEDYDLHGREVLQE